MYSEEQNLIDGSSKKRSRFTPALTNVFKLLFFLQNVLLTFLI